MRVFRFGGKMGEGSAASSSSSEAVTKSRDVHASSRDASSGDDGSSRERLEVRRAALTRDIPAEPRPERPPDPPKTRRQLGLDFLRRDVSHAVRRAATVEPVGVGAPLSEARASDAVARCSTRRITAYVTSDPAPPAPPPRPSRRPPSREDRTRASRTAAVSPRGSAPLRREWRRPFASARRSAPSASPSRATTSARFGSAFRTRSRWRTRARGTSASSPATAA